MEPTNPYAPWWLQTARQPMPYSAPPTGQPQGPPGAQPPPTPQQPRSLLDLFAANPNDPRRRNMQMGQLGVNMMQGGGPTGAAPAGVQWSPWLRAPAGGGY